MSICCLIGNSVSYMKHIIIKITSIFAMGAFLNACTVVGPEYLERSSGIYKRNKIITERHSQFNELPSFIKREQSPPISKRLSDMDKYYIYKNSNNDNPTSLRLDKKLQHPLNTKPSINLNPVVPQIDVVKRPVQHHSFKHNDLTKQPLISHSTSNNYNKRVKKIDSNQSIRDEQTMVVKRPVKHQTISQNNSAY